MKKILYIFGFLMLATFVVKPFIAQSAVQQFSGKEEDVPYSSARVFSKIVSATGANPDADWGQSFGSSNEQDIGKDLYITIYSKTENQPQKQAYKNTAANYGMPESNMVRILYGDYGPLIEKKPTMTQEEAQKKIAEIQQKFKEEKELLSLKANIKAAVEPNEIFANGDLDDSGFDLINDLRIIEQILFLKSQPTDIGGTYESQESTGTGSAAVSSSQSSSASEGYQEPVVGGAGEGDVGQSEGDDAFNEPSTGSGSESGSEPGDDFSVEAQQFDPNSCFANGEYEKALDDFLQKAKEDKNFINNSDSEKLPGSQKNQKKAEKPGDGEGEGELAVTAGQDFLPEVVPPAAPPVSPAPADNWLKDTLCPGILCLEVQFIKKPASSQYSNSDNCIACHVEKTNDVLKDVINHTLAPNKAPGNIGESAKCKDSMGAAFSSISMNVYVVPMPVKTPLNDDLIYGTSIEDEWQTFCNTVSFFPLEECQKSANKGKGSTYTLPPSIVDTVSKKAISQASAGTPTTKVVEDISTAVQGYTIARDEEIAHLNSAQKSDEKVLSFRPLQTEMDNMNLYFNNIRDILHSLHEEVSSVPSSTQACTEILNKKECK